VSRESVASEKFDQKTPSEPSVLESPIFKRKEDQVCNHPNAQLAYQAVTKIFADFPASPKNEHLRRTQFGLVAKRGDLAICLFDHGGEYLPAEEEVESFIKFCHDYVVFHDCRWVSTKEIWAEFKARGKGDAIEVHESAISLRLLDVIKDLPNCRLGIPNDYRQMIFVVFTFDGGFGGMLVHSTQRMGIHPYPSNPSCHEKDAAWKTT